MQKTVQLQTSHRVWKVHGFSIEPPVVDLQGFSIALPFLSAIHYVVRFLRRVWLINARTACLSLRNYTVIFVYQLLISHGSMIVVQAIMDP